MFENIPLWLHMTLGVSMCVAIPFAVCGLGLICSKFEMFKEGNK